MSTIAQKLRDVVELRSIATLNKKGGRLSLDAPTRITYLGVTEKSVHIEFDDGSLLRVINPNFMKGLKLVVRPQELIDEHVDVDLARDMERGK